MTQDRKAVNLTEFQVRNIQILTHLLQYDVVNDEIVEILRLSELEYFALVDKCSLLEKKVNIDEKTHLLKFNQDYLTNIIKTASRILQGMKTKKYTVSFVRFDIDNFSSYNNRYGHALGDEILIKLAGMIRDNSRPTDYVIRFGGEEFDVILPSTDLEGGLKYLEKIFNKTKDLFVSFGGENLGITVSAGLSTFSYDIISQKFVDDNQIEESFQKLQNEADNALYEAKYLGKNRFCVFDPSKKNEYSKIRKLYVK